MTLSEWVRKALLKQPEVEPSPVELALMGELVALRTILLNVLYKIASGEQITVEAMQQLIKRADGDKGQRAAETLTKAGRKCNLPTRVG